ncbi:hypothetical protein HGA64_01270 [Candidatus Falkowbacteria bacterium]|nr:hypothetical protein [Candidatus Falkowbacteria bacterium]
MNLSGSTYRLIRRSYHKRIVVILVVIVSFDYLMFPLPILAKERMIKAEIANKNNLQTVSSFSAAESFFDEKIDSTPDNSANFKEKEPVSKPKVVKVKTLVNHGYHSMTAYNSEAAQTDSSPCTTANGFNVCKHGVEDTIAANFLKFGTKVRIPELFGERVFVVRDRMNARYPDRVDVWFKSKNDALKFGVRKAKIEIVDVVEE